MLTIKIKTIKNPEIDIPSWSVYSASNYSTDYTEEDGNIVQFIEYEDEKGNYRSIDLVEGMTVFFENSAGKTIQRMTIEGQV